MSGCKTCNAEAKRSAKTTANRTECPCDNGFYDDGSNEECIKCPVGCISCKLEAGKAKPTCTLCHEKREIENNCDTSPPGTFIPNVGEPDEEGPTKDCHKTC